MTVEEYRRMEMLQVKRAARGLSEEEYGELGGLARRHQEVLFRSRSPARPANGGCGIAQPSGEGSKPRRMSFKEAITKAENQIGFHEYSRQHTCYGILHDMCRVMAEVYMMAPTATIRINGEDLEAGMVAEVFEEITPEMAEERAEELRGVLPEVKCLKAYLRSALYNKVFEFETAEAKVAAEVERDMGWR
jgi:hypothetical protein